MVGGRTIALALSQRPSHIPRNSVQQFDDIMNSTKVAYQPLAQSSMDFSMPKSEMLPSSHSACEAASPCEHGSCHRQRRRRIFHIAAAIFLLISLFVLLMSQFCDMDTMLGLGADLGGGMLGKRQSNGTTTDHQGLFVKNKLYLIVVIVGLFVLLVLAIMLSAWCCRGAFENPLCCPCYLCACCGGLACLECLSCGLCAEGVADLGYN